MIGDQQPGRDRDPMRFCRGQQYLLTDYEWMQAEREQRIEALYRFGEYVPDDSATSTERV